MMLSAITGCGAYVWGASNSTVVNREEAYDWPVCYFAFAQLWASVIGTQGPQSISEWVILLPKTSFLRDSCLTSFTKSSGGQITSRKWSRVGLAT